MKKIEQRYRDRWDENIMADNCWLLKMDTNKKMNHKRKAILQAIQRFFVNKKYDHTKK